MSDVFIVASGASVARQNLAMLHDRTVIAVNNAWELVPWAAHLYASDGFWWSHYEPDFTGRRWTINRRVCKKYGCEWLNPVCADGLIDKPGQVAHGRNSGYAAINLALHLGAERVYLVGYDYGGKHYFGDHQGLPNPTEKSFRQWLFHMERMDTKGMEVLNCSPDSAIQRFPFVKLEDVA